MVLAGTIMLVLVEGLQGGLVLGGNMEITPDKPLLDKVRPTVVKLVPVPLLQQLQHRAMATREGIHNVVQRAPATRRGASVGRLTSGLKATSLGLR